MRSEDMIEELIAKLAKYPHIRHEQNEKDRLTIFKDSENGFDIRLICNSYENTLCLGAFHWHFDHNKEETDELLSMLTCGLIGSVRIKEFSKNNKAYKWTLETQSEDELWLEYGTAGHLNFNFCSTPEIKYLQNHLLSEEMIEKAHNNS